MGQTAKKDDGGLTGYQWKAVGNRVASSYAEERAIYGEDCGTTIAECMSPQHAQTIVALRAAAIAADDEHDHIAPGAFDEPEWLAQLRAALAPMLDAQAGGE